MRYAIPHEVSFQLSPNIRRLHDRLGPTSPNEFARNSSFISEIAGQIVTNIDRRSVVTACLDQLHKISDSMESAEDAIPKVDSHVVNSFSALFRLFDRLRERLQSSLETNELETSASLLHHITAFMDQTFHHLVAQSITKSYIYSRQGIDRIDVSVQSLCATHRTFKMLKEDIDETEQKLVQIGISSLLCPRRQPRGASDAPRRSHRQRESLPVETLSHSRESPPTGRRRRERRVHIVTDINDCTPVEEIT
jgi:hypothetical protein